MIHRLRCSTACEIFPNQGWNSHLLHWQADSLPLSHQGSPKELTLEVNYRRVQLPLGFCYSQINSLMLLFWRFKKNTPIHYFKIISNFTVIRVSQVFYAFQFSSVQWLYRVQVFATPWIASHQASLSITNSRSSLKLTSIDSVMPCSHLILCHPLLLLPSIPPSIRIFSNESTLLMRWPKFSGTPKMSFLSSGDMWTESLDSTSFPINLKHFP